MRGINLDRPLKYVWFMVVYYCFTTMNVFFWGWVVGPADMEVPSQILIQAPTCRAALGDYRNQKSTLFDHGYLDLLGIAWQSFNYPIIIP